MAGTVKGLREGQHSITAHLVVSGATKALEFYKNAFNAEILGVHNTPDGKVMHAEMKIGDSTIMLADEWPGFSKSPKTLGGSPVILNLYRDNIDELFDQAVKAGATVTMPLSNQFWGDRYGQLDDPFGHKWALGQHIEDVAPDEMERRAKEAFSKMADCAKQPA
ncbi:MAG: VOC family protein [Candidatus Korobacteraceae bacterium]